jgi:hypothetical protein
VTNKSQQDEEEQSNSKLKQVEFGPSTKNYVARR